MTLVLDPALFRPDAVAPDTQALNQRIMEAHRRMPDAWAFPPAAVREARREGRGIFPLAELSPRAETIEIPGPRGPIGLRILRPSGAARGVHLHFHSGGWTLGTPDMHDWLFERYADEAGMAVVSVDYHLAPEWPYPAGPDDCEAAALWLVREAAARFGTERITIGGESAGAHLSLVTLLRLRDRHSLSPFRAMLLNAGAYDLAGTPSARAAKGPKLILDARDLTNFVRCFVPGGLSLSDPDISPLYADLRGLPPALVTIGTADALLDDSLFMAARLAAAGVPVDLDVTPGGVHVFMMFPGPLRDACVTRQVSALANA